METTVLNTIDNRQTQQTLFGGFHNGDGYSLPRKTSAVVQPMQAQSGHRTPENENQPLKPIHVTPVLPGSGSVTHNITRMLADAHCNRTSSTPETMSSTNGNDVSKMYRTPEHNSCSPFYSYIRPTYRQPLLPQLILKSPSENKSTISEDDSVIDVVNDSQEHMRTGDVPNTTDSSMSTRGSSSPQSTGSSSSSPAGSTGSSPGSGCGSATSPDAQDVPPPRKKARTNYSPEQVQTLEKMFHDNPYPDSDMMETLSKDLGVPENKIKVWFQNKRARWRRRVNNNMNNYPHPFMPMSPVISPVSPYGFMQPTPFMTSSPPQVVPAYLNYPSLSPNNNIPSTNVSVSPSHQHSSHPHNMNQSSNTTATQSTILPVISTHSLMSSPHLRHLQYQSFLYPQQYGSYPQNF